MVGRGRISGNECFGSLSNREAVAMLHFDLSFDFKR